MAQALAWERAEEAREQPEAFELRGAQRAPKTWIIEADGKKVGYQDGSCHEVKVGVIYELGERVEVSPRRQELLKREIVARRGHWEEVLQCLEKNRYAMDYAGYQQAGWPLGSGALEGGCRLIGARTNGWLRPTLE